MWDPYADIKQFTLSNGVTVHTLDLPGREWIRVCCIVHVGCERDPVGKEGVTHFVEHMVSKNMYVPYLEMKQFFESLGGSVSFGSTNAHATWYEFFIPNQANVMQQALDWFGDLLFSRRLVDGIEHERGVITREFHQKYPFSYRHDRILHINRSLFPDQWYARQTRPLGLLETIATLTVEDLQSQYDMYYTPANVEVLCVGGISGLSIQDLFAHSHMNQEKDGRRFSASLPVADIPLPGTSHEVFSLSTVTDAKTESAAFAQFCVMPVQTKPFVYNLTSAVCYNFLFEELRTVRGLVYGVNVDWDNYRDHLVFTIGASGIDPTKIHEVESLVQDQLSHLLGDEERFIRCKDRLLQQIRMKDLSGKSIIDSARRELVAHGQIRSDHQDLDSVEKVFFEDVQPVLSRLNSQSAMTVLEVP